MTGPSHTQGKEAHKALNTRRQELLGVILESVCNKKEMEEMTNFEYKEGKLRELTHRRWLLS